MQAVNLDLMLFWLHITFFFYCQCCDYWQVRQCFPKPCGSSLGCHKGTIEEANAAGLVEVWLLSIITSRHESLDQPNQADVIFYPVSLSRHISWVDAQIAAAEKHPWPKINPHAPQIIAGLALLNLWYTTTSRVQNKNNKLTLMRHWKITWKCAASKNKKTWLKVLNTAWQHIQSDFWRWLFHSLSGRKSKFKYIFSK